MKGTLLGITLIAGLILTPVTSRAEEGQGFAFKGLVLEVAMYMGQIRVNETWLKITSETEVFNLNGDPANAEVLKVGDRVRVIGEHKNGYDEALQIVQVPKRPPQKRH